MIKKVNVDQLRVGIFVHDFNSNWNGSALYIEPSYINSESTINILKNWNIHEVFIDTARGLDIDKSLFPSKISKATTPFGLPRNLPRPSVPLKIELQSSRRITEEAIRVVQTAYHQAMDGSIPEVGPFYELAKQMQASIQRNHDALSLLSRIRQKDEYTLFHSVSVSSHVLNMCRYYEVSEHQSLDMAVGALFHDIGKALVPQTILNKPGKLTEEEFGEMKRHVELSMEMLSKTKGIPVEGYDIALHHHERYDGKGYPHGLANDQISFAAQVTSICDVFDAVTSERCYKAGMESVMGLRLIYEGGGTHFSKELTHDFIRCIGMYPVGTCVMLANGKSGVVVSSTEDMARPVIQILYDDETKERVNPYTIDLSRTEDSIVSYSDARKFGLTYDQLLRRFLLAAN